MTLKERLQDDLKTAMKEKDTIRKNVVIMTKAAVLQIEKDKKIELDDEGVIDVVAKGVKQRKDAIPEFERGKRLDVVEDLKREIAFLMAYLPQQLNEAEIRKIVTDTISEVGATSAKEMGKVMGALQPKIKGKADGKLVNTIVKEILS